MAAIPAYPYSSQSDAWYALYVRSRHERVVEQTLKGRGYPAFSPFYRMRRKRSDRTKELDVPLFPGYVFCQFDPNRRLPVLTTPGVVFVVGAGNIPEAVQESEIASIQTVAQSGKPVQPWPFLQAGQRVRILAGPLYGVEGRLLKMKNECRLVISVTILQRSLAMEVDQDSVAPVF